MSNIQSCHKLRVSYPNPVIHSY